MASTKIVLGFVLSVACLCTVALAEVPRNCCLDVRESSVDIGAWANYYPQVAGQGCAINAMVLVSRRGVTICVPPDGPRLSDIMAHVDKLRGFCKSRNYKPKRCFGVME